MGKWTQGLGIGLLTGLASCAPDKSTDPTTVRIRGEFATGIAAAQAQGQEAVIEKFQGLIDETVTAYINASTIMADNPAEHARAAFYAMESVVQEMLDHQPPKVGEVVTAYIEENRRILRGTDKEAKARLVSEIIYKGQAPVKVDSPAFEQYVTTAGRALDRLQDSMSLGAGPRIGR